jgi:hypothetical protein
LEVAGQVGEQVEGSEVLLGDDGPSAGGLGLERDGHRQAVGAEEHALGWWAGLAELGDAGSADADDVGDGGQGVAVLAEPGDALAAEPSRLGHASL